MAFPYSQHAVYLFLSATLTLIAAVIAWRRRAPGSVALGLLLFAMSIWAGLYAVYWLPLSPQVKILLPHFTYIGVTTVPTLFLIFALSYNHHGRWLTFRRLVLLGLEPFLTLLLIWTNGRHHLVFSSVTTLEQDGFLWLELARGPWYMMNVLYSYVMILTGLGIFVYGMWRSSPLLKHQYRLILLAAMVPWLMNAYNEVSFGVERFDVVPLLFGLSGILFTYSVIRNRFMDVVPVARSRLVESMSDGILVLDGQDRVVDANPAMGEFLSRKPASLLRRPAAEVLDAWLGDSAPLLRGQETRLAKRLPTSPPRYLDLRVTPLYDPHQRLSGRLVVVHDITDHKHVEKKLRFANERLQSQLIEIGTLQSRLRSQAIHDPLTDLFNRRYLDETLDRELARAGREGYPLCITMMDIDHFKRINDTHGHEAGDMVLKALAATLVARNRRGDFSCRFGGEEFVVVMPNIAVGNAYKRAEQLRTTLNALRVPFGQHHLAITLSMGIACYPDHGAGRDALLRAADRAMYAAKQAGRDYICISERLDVQSDVLSD